MIDFPIKNFSSLLAIHCPKTLLRNNKRVTAVWFSTNPYGWMNEIYFTIKAFYFPTPAAGFFSFLLLQKRNKKGARQTITPRLAAVP